LVNGRAVDYDLADHLALSPQHAAVIPGQTRSFDFPVTPDAYQPVLGGFLNPFVTAIAEVRRPPEAKWFAAPVQLHFPATRAGSTGTRLLRLINAGPGRVTLNLGQPAPPFSAGPPDPVTLDPKQVATIGVSFSPSQRGGSRSTLQLISYYPEKRVVNASEWCRAVRLGPVIAPRGTPPINTAGSAPTAKRWR
jgi:hypothetical protein